MELIITTLQTLNIDYIVKDRGAFIHKYDDYTLRISTACILNDYHIDLFYRRICIFDTYILASCLFNYVKLMEIIIYILDYMRNIILHKCNMNIPSCVKMVQHTLNN